MHRLWEGTTTLKMFNTLRTKALTMSRIAAPATRLPPKRHRWRPIWALCPMMRYGLRTGLSGAERPTTYDRSGGQLAPFLFALLLQAFGKPCRVFSVMRGRAQQVFDLFRFEKAGHMGRAAHHHGAVWDFFALGH